MGIFDEFAAAADAERRVFTVEQLNREARRAIEDTLGVVWVEGEISNLARPASGHLYWTLKDERAQLRCAMFRQRNRQLDFEPRNGQQVLLRGRVSIYEARGEFQLVVDSAEPAGEGILRRRFEALKLKLAAEGLFAEERKKPLPTLPARIGVVTSPTGAAIRDILTVLRRRFPATSVLIYPTPVQGETAAAEIASTLALANRRHDCNLLILARGGGSLEDLWAFNEEVVARALAALDLPVIVGVGHEVDFTIADFVADQRAPTPSGAAELAVPDRSQWIAATQRIERQLDAAAIRRVAQRRDQWTALARRLQRAHPGMRLNQVGQRLDELDARLRRRLAAIVRERRADLVVLSGALRAAAPRVRIGQLRERCQWAGRSLNVAMTERLQAYRARIAGAARALDAVSPLATLERGYAIATRTDGELIRDVTGLAIGAEVRIRVSRGTFGAKVATVEPAAPDPASDDD
jgi:exodeoxyribonuclease VII large subunit